MKNNEALALSIEACKDEIDNIYKLIEIAAKSGKTSVFIEKLSYPARSKLVKDGYNLSYYASDEIQMATISWDYN